MRQRFFTASSTPAHGCVTRGPLYRTNVDGLRNVLEVAKAADLNRFVFEGLPAVAMCVAMTYGAGDWQPTPHSAILAAAAAGRMPFYINNLATESVGIDDAAEAKILASERRRPGQRYIISERYLEMRDLLTTAAEAVGARPPRMGIPLPLAYRFCALGDVAARVLRRELRLSTMDLRLLDLLPRMEHDKATRELGWCPESTLTAIEQAAHFFQNVTRTR